MFADGQFDRLGRADDFVAAGDVAAFAVGHEARPAGGDEGAGARARDAGGGVHAAGPIGRDEVLVRAEGGGAVEEDRVPFGREAVFVRVAGDAGDALEGEVEWSGGESCASEERDQEGAEAAIDMER